MKTTLKTLLVIALLTIYSSSYASIFHFSDYAHLNIYNDWSYPIELNEGQFWKTTETLNAGNSKKMIMVTYLINELSIKYLSNSVWVQIPGCPRGTYSYTNMNVYIVPNPLDNKTPMCERELWPVIADGEK